MVWYSHLLKNFPEFVVVHTVKGFSIANKAGYTCFRCFLELSCLFDDSMKVKSLSRVRLFVTPWNVAYQAPLSMGFSSQ